MAPECFEEFAEAGPEVLSRYRPAAAELRLLLQQLVLQLAALQEPRPPIDEVVTKYLRSQRAGNPSSHRKFGDELQAALRATSLHERAKTLLNLATVLARLAQIERKAWALDDRADDRCYEDVLAEVYAKGGNARAAARTLTNERKAAPP